ncbi:thioesterase family protein [Bacillus sp. CLL-7-23]|uniref:Thioesterase family protein n=1 Tax=Bacillus changyiensis TaxID=3004103 RepID=A0ABT4X4A3_9BACI|nr:thioesterase family protein [Bacillus changyiensis]MDA7027138.1 thioesterase family protein [Bacillus changyiensis]
MKLPDYIGEPFEEWCESFRFFDEVNVRFSETDMFGHMNNVTPFIYFEEARIAYLKQLGIEMDGRHTGAIVVVASQQCDYLRQIMLHETLKIGVKTASVGTTSVMLHYLAKNEEAIPCFTGNTVIVKIAKEKGTPANWTKEEKQRLSSLDIS